MNYIGPWAKPWQQRWDGKLGHALASETLTHLSTLMSTSYIYNSGRVPEPNPSLDEGMAVGYEHRIKTNDNTGLHNAWACPKQGEKHCSKSSPTNKSLVSREDEVVRKWLSMVPSGPVELFHKLSKTKTPQTLRENQSQLYLPKRPPGGVLQYPQRSKLVNNGERQFLIKGASVPMATGDDKIVQVVAELFGRLALEGQAVLRTPAQENSQAERARARRPSSTAACRAPRQG